MSTGWSSIDARGVCPSRLLPDPTRAIVFSRIPRAGTTKTRLIPRLGPDGAAQLQRDMTRRTLRAVAQWQLAGNCHAELCVTGGSPEAARRCFGDLRRVTEQGGGSLGARLARSFRRAFDAGYARVLAVGTDIPGLDSRRMLEATLQLQHADVVLGPTHDGGYYLIGASSPVPFLFDDMPWGTDRVFDETVDRIERRGLKWARLPLLSDIDRPEDIELWEIVERQKEAARIHPSIGVVIATWNEIDQIEATIASVRQGDHSELIVVDGESEDGTADRARELGAFCLEAPRGRGAQFNVGIAASTADVVVLLHADTRLPRDYDRSIRSTMAGERHIAGAFRLAFDGDRRSLRWIARGANFRSRWRRLPYGDQALFLRTETLVSIGGLRRGPMEDYALVRALRRRGRIALADESVTTSARKYLRQGPWRTVLEHQKMLVRWHLGSARLNDSKR